MTRDLWHNLLWQWLKEGCHKPVLGVGGLQMFTVYHQLQSEARNFFAKSVILFTSNEAVVSSSLEWNDLPPNSIPTQQIAV